jgi:hypothetical protein
MRLQSTPDFNGAACSRVRLLILVKLLIGYWQRVDNLVDALRTLRKVVFGFETGCTPVT